MLITGELARGLRSQILSPATETKLSVSTAEEYHKCLLHFLNKQDVPGDEVSLFGTIGRQRQNGTRLSL